MLLLFFQFSDFLSEPLVLFIGGLEKLILLFEALFEFRGQRGMLLRGVGGRHLAGSQRQGSRLIGIGIPFGRRFGAVNGVALVHDIGIVGIFVPAYGIGFHLFGRSDARRVGHVMLLRQRPWANINGGRMGGSATGEQERGE